MNSPFKHMIVQIEWSMAWLESNLEALVNMIGRYINQLMVLSFIFNINIGQVLYLKI